MKPTLVSLLALAGTALGHAHHDDAEVVPESLREELLKKWDQEV
jgi:agmatinase